MTGTLRLMAVLAHPDDEAMGMGVTLARYAGEGVETYLVCATRGERGWNGPPEEFPGPERLGVLREGELAAAAQALGLREVHFLGYMDGDLSKAGREQAIRRIVGHIRRLRPHVLVTWGPDGAYGHPDHIATSQFTSAAVICSADAAYDDGGAAPPHRVTKFYYLVEDARHRDVIGSLVGPISMEVDGVRRELTPWPDWAITTRIRADDYVPAVRKAIMSHGSQVKTMFSRPLSDAEWTVLCREDCFYRVFTTVDGAAAGESDLFTGLR